MNVVILDDYQDAVRKLDCIKEIENLCNIKIYTSKVKGISQLNDRLKDAEILILNFARTHINQQILARANKLKLIVQIGEITPHLDIEACNKLNIAVIEGNEGQSNVAEFTWALIMTVMHRIPQYANMLRHGGWQQSGLKQASMPLNFSLSQTVKNKTLGILGLGKIGTLVANYGKVFGMNILVFGGVNTQKKAQDLGYTIAQSSDELFQKSDVLSIHQRLNSQNQRKIGLKQLLQMKPTALLVNTANAALIDTEALVTALSRGTPGLAAIDVYDTEPIMQGHALLRLENCICTPHIANVDKESIERHYTAAFQHILAYIQNNNSNQ